MDPRSSSREQLSVDSLAEDEQLGFRKYYTERNYFLSPEGFLKVLSVIVCIVSGVVFGQVGGCGGGAAAVPLSCAAATAALYAGVALRLPLFAPHAYLFTDIIISTAMGILLLITAVLSMTVCEFTSVASFMHGPLAMVNAGIVTASAVITYMSVMRVSDEPRPRPRPAPALTPTQDTSPV